MRFLRSSSLVTALLVAALAAWLPAESVAELAKWDQDRVAKIGDSLSTAASELHSAMRKVPPPTAGSGQSRAWHRAIDRVRLIQSESRRLATRLADGKGHDETFPVWERLMMLVRDAREEGRRLFIAEPVMDKIAGVRDQLRQLAPYYDPKALEGNDSQTLEES